MNLGAMVLDMKAQDLVFLCIVINEYVEIISKDIFSRCTVEIPKKIYIE